MEIKTWGQVYLYILYILYNYIIQFILYNLYILYIVYIIYNNILYILEAYLQNNDEMGWHQPR